MTYSEAILFGAVQGITEYLPISSSAHLILLPRFLGTQDPGLAFDVFLHAGTLASTLLYFWKDWREVLSGMPGVGGWMDRRTRSRDAEAPSREIWKFLTLATIPALVAGAALHRIAEESLRGNGVMVTTLVVGGFMLWAADRFVVAGGSMKSLDRRTAIGVGLMQCLALVPGMSRSGSTMTGGRLFGLNREAAARFSFLLSAPVTAAALIFELRKWDAVVADIQGVGPLIVGAITAFVFGWFAIDGLLKIVRQFGYLSFAAYRVVLAVVIFFYLGV